MTHAQPSVVSVPVETLRTLSESLKFVAGAADANRCLIANLLGDEMPVDLTALAEHLGAPRPTPSKVADFASYRARRAAS